MATRRIKFMTTTLIFYLSFHIVRGLEYQFDDPLDNNSFQSLYTGIFNWENDKNCPNLDELQVHESQGLGYFHSESDIQKQQGALHNELIHGAEVGQKLSVQYDPLQDISLIHTNLRNVYHDAAHPNNHYHGIEGSVSGTTHGIDQASIQGTELADMAINQEPQTWYHHHPSIENQFTAPLYFSHTPEDTNPSQDQSAYLFTPSDICSSFVFPLSRVDDPPNINTWSIGNDILQEIQSHQEQMEFENAETIPNQQLMDHVMNFSSSSYPVIASMQENSLQGALKFSSDKIPSHSHNIIDSGSSHRGIRGNSLSSDLPVGPQKECFDRTKNALEGNKVPQDSSIYLDSLENIAKRGGGAWYEHTGQGRSEPDCTTLHSNHREKPTKYTEPWSMETRNFPMEENMKTVNDSPIPISSGVKLSLQKSSESKKRIANPNINWNFKNYKTKLAASRVENSNNSNDDSLFSSPDVALSFPNDKMPHHFIRNLQRRIPTRLQELGNKQLRMYSDLVNSHEKWFLDWKERFKVSVENLDLTGDVLTGVRKNLESAGRKANSAVLMVFLGLISFVDASEIPEIDCHNLLKESLDWIQRYIDGFAIFDSQKIHEILGSETEVNRYACISPFRVLRELLFLHSARDFKLYLSYKVWKTWRNDKMPSSTLVPYELLNKKLRRWVLKSYGIDQSYVRKKESYSTTIAVPPKLSKIATSRQTVLDQGRLCVTSILLIEQELRDYFKHLRSSLLAKISDKQSSLEDSEMTYCISKVENAINNLRLRLVPSIFGVVKIVIEKDSKSSEFLHMILVEVWDFLQTQFSILTNMDFDKLFLVGFTKPSHASSTIQQDFKYMIELFQTISSKLKIVKVEPTIWDLLKHWPKPSSIKDHVKHLENLLETCGPEQFPVWLEENGFYF